MNHRSAKSPPASSHTVCCHAEGAHIALQAWHAEWLLRQHNVMLAVLQMYCNRISRSMLPTELQPFLLLEGAVSAAVCRQSLAADVATVELPVVLDSAAVSEGLWLGLWMQTTANHSRCDLRQTLLSARICRVQRARRRSAPIVLPSVLNFGSVWTAQLRRCSLSMVLVWHTRHSEARSYP
jgi:hypothetical protein